MARLTIKTENSNKYANDVMHNILKYSAEQFQSFDVSTQAYYAEQAIIAKKYHELRHILNISSDNYMLSKILNEAIDRQDKEAITVITEFSKKSTNKYLESGSYINKCMIADIYNYDKGSLVKRKDDTLKKDIIKLLLNAKSNSTLDAEDLQKLSFIYSKKEFEQFCQNKELNITDEKFKALDLSSYKYENELPVQIIDNKYHLVDLLLNRTYSDSLSANSIKKIYNKIYSINSISKEMLTYSATLIANGNPLKIIFENGTLSFYSPMQNLIKIDTKFINEPIFNIESVVSHEFMHFFYDQLFNNDLQPFNTISVQNITESFENDDYFPSINNFKTAIESLPNLLSEGSKFFDNYYNYTVAATGPLKYAAKLLNIDLIDSNSTIIAWAQHLKFDPASDLQLFHIKSNSTYLQEEIEGNGTNTLSDSTYHTLIAMHHKYENFPEFHNKTAIATWASEVLYPKVLVKLNLSMPEIHFLERIADYVNRAEFFPKITYSCMSRSNDKNLNAELIVRSLELQTAMPQETAIIQSFMALDQYHNEFASPMVSAFLSGNHQISCLPFSEQFLGKEFKFCDAHSFDY